VGQGQWRSNESAAMTGRSQPDGLWKWVGEVAAANNEEFLCSWVTGAGTELGAGRQRGDFSMWALNPVLPRCHKRSGFFGRAALFGICWSDGSGLPCPKPAVFCAWLYLWASVRDALTQCDRSSIRCAGTKSRNNVARL
jgi:hypothetical protein